MNPEIIRLALQALRGKKQKSALMFAVLFVSFLFAVVMICYTGSIDATNGEYRLDTYGAWYGAIPSGQEGDEAWLLEQEWLSELGVSVSYGTVSYGTGRTGIGTVDETFLTIGRITMQDGSLPQSDDGIAMEADVLSGLGYDYTLGQEITLTVAVTMDDTVVYLEKSYTLCGIIREYTNLWSLTHNRQNRLLNGAILTEAAAESLWEEAANETAAEQSAADQVTVEQATSGFQPVSSWFFTVKEGSEDEMTSQVNSYLSSSRTSGSGLDTSVCVNTLAYGGRIESDYNTFFVLLVYAVTLIAVVSIYSVQMQDEVHRIALFRSIGISKGQLKWMQAAETLILCIPAMLLGAALSPAALWPLLRFTVSSGSVAVSVQIRWAVLLKAGAAWMLGILAVRLLILQAALLTPLTGRFHIQVKKERGFFIFRRAMLFLLTALLCAVATFTVMESLHPAYQWSWWSKAPSYVVYRSGFSKDASTALVTEGEVELMELVPGVEQAAGFAEQTIELSFDGMEENTLAAAYGLNENGSGLSVTLYAVEPDEWEGTFDFTDSGVDMDAFERGECVAILFYVEGGAVTYNEVNYEDVGIAAGDVISLSVNENTEALSVTVGGILYFADDTMHNRLLSGVYEPYTIVCSQQFLKKVLNTLEPGSSWGKYTASDEAGYSRVYLYADQNAGYLSTDTVLAQIAAQNDLTLSNRREEYSSYVQQYLQALLMVFISGSASLIMLLMITANTLKLETKRELRKYGILQAIGMGRRQIAFSLLWKSLLTAVAGVVSGRLIYGLYVLYDLIQTRKEYTLAYGYTYTLAGLWETKLYRYKLDGREWMIAALTAAEIVVIVAVYFAAKRKLLTKEPMEKIRDER
ncbi:MAG: FtsX-like permease family protein [Lachnospiraceae bacterium]|nr:FtsX-like permease family protein [Lachnospiraceae bacterium]